MRKSVRCFTSAVLVLCLSSVESLVSPQMVVKLHPRRPSVLALNAAMLVDESMRFREQRQQDPINEKRQLFSSPSLMLQWYEKSLQQRPLVTKCTSSAIIGCISDILSQTLQAFVAGKPLIINFRQVGAFGLTGLLYIGPFFHFWFEQLWKIGRWLETRHGTTKQKQVLTQILVDQTVGVAIFFPIYFFVFEILEAFTSCRAPLLVAARNKCIKTVGVVLLANWRIWPLINYVNFTVIPPSLRLLFRNLVSVVWNAFFYAMLAKC